MSFVPGDALRRFAIIVGPHKGNYKNCGPHRIDMSLGETRSFLCEPHAIGTSVTIKRAGFNGLATCEVQIFGKGMITYMTILHYLSRHTALQRVTRHTVNEV